MPLTPLFTVAQPNETTIRLTDTSTGNDPDITQRRVYLQQADGSYLVPQGTLTDYIEWDYGDATIDIAVLDKDYALQILVQWLDVGNIVLYDKPGLNGFPFNEKAFMYNLTTLQEANPSIASNTNYYANKAKLWVEIISAENAITIGDDITSAQNCFNRGTYLINNQNLFF